MPRTLPRPALWLGLAGLLPFLAAALLAWTAPGPWRGVALQALAAYGAVILSFLGAVHWGLALRAPAEEAAATAPRLGLGVLPSLIAWAALLLPPVPGLLLLALGILGTAAVETLAARQGLLPEHYLWLRWILSAGAALSLFAGIGAVP
ncbi:DUF3429 domain-containing protein [Paracraurococcus lichenis]|uniref:DUF3429 domain-containing protein n=1 Tax=Paracraurococcus lichenis TaxID=3064888 RepID=A0ABT9DVK4_9PROT|nr:DUF3429 domain-containing protein [Paracraurococcus sp. LOR1-02]MDO9707930.1 DUF3429 domain-containing protein [Paracraurococcus sp. LOR1-02]